MLKDWIRLIRPADWLKNIFVFAPLFFASQLFQLHAFLIVLTGAILFSLTASSIYILNDIKDRTEDRMHAVKCKRPIARGAISPNAAAWFFVTLSIVSFVGAVMLSYTFFYVIITYYFINIAYCFYLKRIAIIDVYCIAAGFLLRVMGGAFLIHVTLSVWMLICTGLLALFLAFAKRRDDFARHLDETHRKSISGYNVQFIDVAITMTLSALFIQQMENLSILPESCDVSPKKINSPYVLVMVIAPPT